MQNHFVHLETALLVRNLESVFYLTPYRLPVCYCWCCWGVCFVLFLGTSNNLQLAKSPHLSKTMCSTFLSLSASLFLSVCLFLIDFIFNYKSISGFVNISSGISEGQKKVSGELNLSSRQ